MESLQTTNGDMVALARSRRPADRERLLMSVADLCEDGAALSPDAKATLQAIFMDLVAQAERDIRRRLAEKLAGAAWAPRALITVLALDEIEIARPVIARSAELQDADLIRLLVEATLEHQIEVARRPDIGPRVVDAILDQSQPHVLAALADNVTARVTPLHMQALVLHSRRIVALRGSLARHPKLTGDLAHALHGWVGEALRASIAERFTLDEALLAKNVSEAVADVLTGELAPPVAQTQAARERAEMERRLIEKLEAAGQLRPSYLLRALRDGRGSLFESALAVLGGYQVDHIRKAVSGDRVDLLALACAGVGIDRSVFPSVLGLVRGLNQGRPASGAGAETDIAYALSMPPERAAERFRAAATAI